MAKTTNKLSKALNAWELSMNPLRSLTANQIEVLLEQSKNGNDVRLQTAFYQMERTMPIFSICIQKRISGVLTRQWKILPNDETPEAKLQAERVQKLFDRSDRRVKDSLTDCLRHLVLAAFRGRAVVKPFAIDGELVFKKIENWNVLDYKDKLYWNPDTLNHSFFVPTIYDKNDVTTDLQELPEHEVICVRDSLPIDIPGIQIYLRQLVGEQQWARFVEKQGIPQILITAPEGTPDSALDVWNQRAMQIYEGGSGVLPPGANVNEMTAARGQDPFSAFCQHQMEMIAILATGGSLSTIGGATGLGSNLADVQNDQFQQLISYDCKRIQNAMTAVAVRKAIYDILGENSILCRFEFVENDNTTAEQYLEMASKLASIGVPLNLTELKKLTNLSFIKDGSEKAADDVWTPSNNEAE